MCLLLFDAKVHIIITNVQYLFRIIAIDKTYWIMELRHLRYFVEVAEQQHYGSQDQHCGQAEPALAANRNLNAARHAEATTASLAAAVFNVFTFAVFIIIAHGVGLDSSYDCSCVCSCVCTASTPLGARASRTLDRPHSA